MKEKKDIDPINNKGKYHGYQEWYTKDNILFLRVTMKHGQPNGYEECHLKSDLVTNYYIK